MPEYHAPQRDMMFVLTELAGLADVAGFPAYRDATAETVAAILDEAARLATQVLAPLNQSGDTAGCVWHDDGSVSTPRGHREAYGQFVAGGWNGLAFPPEFGGQGLPKLVASAVSEMFMSANMGFSLCPMLTAGAIEALLLVGSDAQKARYLHKLVEGTWTGTMNLTEPQAGSDLGAIRTRAVPDGDRYRLYGQKIFITHGEHDLAENIVHLVLARVPGAPEGVKGISLFLVPKFLVDENGALQQRNDVRCVSIEHKLGIHASPTAVLAYGDEEGAVGYRVGELNRGLEYMFIMMNEARFAVGLQGVGIAERAYQQALSYARERVQSKDLADPRGEPVTLIHHPDVRRMLMSMKAITEANRAVAYTIAAAADRAHHAADEAERTRSRQFYEFMIPIHKGWATESAIEVTNDAIQVHGGVGFIEETGVAQHMRDARITSIYEGTTGIQANDLIGRKIARDGGKAARAVASMMRDTLAELDRSDDAALATIRARLAEAVDAFEISVDWLIETYRTDSRSAHASAVPFLKLAALVCGGWQMARAALVAERRLLAREGDTDFMHAKISTATFYANHLLVRVGALRHTILLGAEETLALAPNRF